VPHLESISFACVFHAIISCYPDRFDISPHIPGQALSTKSDGKFYVRADAFIHLANEQMKDGATPEDVCESIMYAAARFTASYTASLTGSADNAEIKRPKAIDFLTDKYRTMVTSNYDETTEDMKTGRGNPH
jgi:hypothetical protein